jgi:cell division protein FtsZ
MLLIAAGMGGGTGTGAAPVIAKRAKDMGILTMGVVSLPYDYEGQKRKQKACHGITNIVDNLDSLIVIPNNIILEIYEDLDIEEAFIKTDEVITNVAKTVSSIIHHCGLINVDMNDVKAVMKDSGYAHIGVGIAEGSDRAIRAVKDAIENPLLADIELANCKGLLISIAYGDLKAKVNELGVINDIITNATGLSGEIVTSCTYDETLDEKIQVTLIATGLAPSNAVIKLQEEILGKPRIATPQPVKVRQGVIFDDVNEQKTTVIRPAATWDDTVNRLNKTKYTEFEPVARAQQRGEIFSRIDEAKGEQNQFTSKPYPNLEINKEEPPAFLKKYIN